MPYKSGVQAGVLRLTHDFGYTCLSTFAIAALLICLLFRYDSRPLAPVATYKELQQWRAPSIAARRIRGHEVNLPPRRQI